MKTKVVIRAKAKDAKFIGTTMGGALVIVKDYLTGEILDKGIIKGSTGDTKRIMATPWQRGVPLSDENTAGFIAWLDLDEPRLVEIIAYAPYGQAQAMAKASITTWIVPGKHIEGEGIVLDFPGLVVRICEPPAPTSVRVPTEVHLKVHVAPMCGCPIAPKTYWPPEMYEVAAFIKKEENIVSRKELTFCGKRNCFETYIKLEEPGNYELVAYAFDSKTGNTGADKTTIVASK
ncbi:hypothetical protein [Thermodesulfatator autotrophicus]|uniref:Uncharacterized protein n=1 Tax=Thermodesulfatator autotrophicus TaxID=1795632 RepID=A0A177E9V4_9BACT|nr:hypothetical protein [Thermodesulfatator autotrophicus]OAG28516.1 hypothetical protein TH606_01415 [Thermodesulfatator autotrophicus]